MATFLAACMLMGAVPATAFAAKETTEAAETIPQVYRMDDDNDTVRLVIGKTPTLYIGKNGTVSVTLMNMEDKDWIETEIWIASEDISGTIIPMRSQRRRTATARRAASFSL